ncbi:MAG: multiheme c-type cytochrome [Myxococcota bacterium]
MRSRTRALALVAAAFVACGQSEREATREPTAAELQPAARREKPLPAFEGWTLEDERLEISSLLGRRLLLFIFNPEVKAAPHVARAISEIAALRGKHNFEIVGAATGSDLATARAFTAEYGFDFPVIDDSSAAIARRLRLRGPLAVLGVDAEGYVIFGSAFGETEDPNAAKAIENQLRSALRLPPIASDTEPLLGSRPLAPTFRADVLDGSEPFDLAAQRGKPVVLIFFLHTCSHCHQTLEFLKETLAELPEDKRPTVVGVEVSGRTHSVRELLSEKGLDFFPVVFDDDGSLQAAYGAFAGVPDTVLIDAEGRIASRVRGWQLERDPPLMRMRLAKLVGAPVPMLLRSNGYSGSEVCGVCHESEHETWQLTHHASAFDTLVEHGANEKVECVGCHVVGYQHAGGFISSVATRELEDVGCESCHGRGGPHLSPTSIENGSYEAACLTCHDTKHSLGFEYARFLPRVSHAALAHVAALPPAEKQKLLAERSRPREDLLPTAAPYVGSAACESCHPAEFASWESSAHAGAVTTLAAAGKQDDAACLKCHTTGFGRPGGFPTSGTAGSHRNLARVGCESCHGPGGAHVEDGAARAGTIVSLADKCDSCVILQICGTCHDEANDPGFEFEVLEKIELQRHGTIEPGTGKPKGTSAGAEGPLRLEARIARAFDRLDGGN